MKTSELTGAELDLWVARAEGKCYSAQPGVWGRAFINDLGRLSITKNTWDCAKYFEPSKNWLHGGPILEREGIDLEYHKETVVAVEQIWWEAYYRSNVCQCFIADTPLIAAMRAYVASKFGEEVPDEPA